MFSSRLPEETCLQIFNNVDIPTLIKCTFVSKQWRDFSNRDKLWEKFFINSEKTSITKSVYLQKQKTILASQLDSINDVKKKLFSAKIKTLILYKILNFEETLSLTNLELCNINSLFTLIMRGYLSLKEVKSVTAFERTSLADQRIYRLIYSGILTLQAAKYLSSDERNNLGAKGICELVLKKHLDLDTAKKLTFTQRDNLNDAAIVDAICNGNLLIDEAKDFTTEQRMKVR